MSPLSPVEILPLLLCVSSAAVFQVNESQQLYEAQENQNVQLEWTFTTSPHMKMTSLSIYCGFHGLTEALVYRVVGGMEHPQTENNSFTGRVQSDTEALREGRIILHLSRVRCADSGIYYCEVFTKEGHNTGECRLNVSAAVRAEAEPDPRPVDWQRMGLYAILALTAALLPPLSVYAGVQVHSLMMERRRQQQGTPVV